MSYKCHVQKCDIEVEPRMLMCSEHWKKVPKEIQKQVCDNYTSAQSTKKVRPTQAWLRAARAALFAVEGKEPCPACTRGEYPHQNCVLR